MSTIDHIFCYHIDQIEPTIDHIDPTIDQIEPTIDQIKPTINDGLIEFTEIQLRKLKRKFYRRDYYNRKYNTDAEYREDRRAYNKEVYQRKTVDCTICFRRIRKIFETSICEECFYKSVPQIKSNYGRKKKIIEANLNE
jgi:t-SNARE complex subunit (syntaxin)